MITGTAYHIMQAVLLFLLFSSKNKTHCNSIITKDYKFYLAFENSLCVDYISEKFWRAMSWDLVPIVLGE